MRRYPFANLCEALHVTPTDLKRRLGLDHRQLSRYLEQGLPEARADELACRLGLVTVNVWPEMIEHAIEDASVECADQACNELFVPSRKGHKFCSERCQRRDASRRHGKRRWIEDPEWRARKASAVRRYNEEAARAVLARKRARYQERAEEERAARRARYARNPERWRAYQADYRRQRQSAA